MTCARRSALSSRADRRPAAANSLSRCSPAWFASGGTYGHGDVDASVIGASGGHSTRGPVRPRVARSGDVAGLRRQVAPVRGLVRGLGRAGERDRRTAHGFRNTQRPHPAAPLSLKTATRTGGRGPPPLTTRRPTATFPVVRGNPRVRTPRRLRRPLGSARAPSGSAEPTGLQARASRS